MDAQVNDVGSGRRARRALALRAAALVVLCSLAAGCFFSDAEEMGVVWDTPADRKAEQHGNGAWLSGDTLVRSRFDAVSGYDARTGKRSWEYVPPGRSAVCHVTADTAGSVLVLTRDGDGAGASAKVEFCATTVAIDMKSGREIWQATLSDSLHGLRRFQPSPVSAGSGIAVLLTQGELQAVDVRSGQPRWKAALPKGCVPGRTMVAARQVAALLACGGTGTPGGDKVPRDAEHHAAAFDPATGALLWSAPLGGREPIRWNARAEFVSADPLVVAASSSGDSESGAYFSFGGNGRPNPPIDFRGAYGQIRPNDRLKAAADESRLYTPTFHQGQRSRDNTYRLTAFDLATGEAVWGGTTADDRLDGDTGYRLLPQDGKLTVLTSRARSSHHGVRVLDAATGKQRDARSFPEAQDTVDTLFPYGDRLIGARYGSQTEPSKPFTAYEGF